MLLAQSWHLHYISLHFFPYTPSKRNLTGALAFPLILSVLEYKNVLPHTIISRVWDLSRGNYRTLAISHKPLVSMMQSRFHADLKIFILSVSFVCIFSHATQGKRQHVRLSQKHISLLEATTFSIVGLSTHSFNLGYAVCDIIFYQYHGPSL